METICGICKEKKECKEILGDTFTDLDNLKIKHFCKDCQKLFDNKWLKTGFYWTQEKKRAVKQNEFADILRNIEFPCLLSFSESRKKHRLFRSKWSCRRQEVHISTDTGEVVLNLDKDLPLLNYLEDFYKNNKCSKTWMFEEFPVNFIKKIGISKYLEFREKVKKYKGTQKYKLLINFLNK